MIRHALPLTLVLLAACARSEDASNTSIDSNSLEVERVRSLDQGEEVAIGEWRDSLQEEYAALEFGPAGAPPVFSLRCDERRGILLQRHGAEPIGDLPMMLVSIGSETRRLAVTSAGGSIPMLRASLPPQDPLIDRLAEVDGPITIRIGDAVPLVLPPGPAIGTFVARCSSGERQPAATAADNAAEANATEPAGNGSATQ